MAPKRQRAKSSPKFISTQALETFNRLVVEKNCVQEKGFENPCGFVEDVIEN